MWEPTKGATPEEAVVQAMEAAWDVGFGNCCGNRYEKIYGNCEPVRDGLLHYLRTKGAHFTVGTVAFPERDYADPAQQLMISPSF